MKLNIDEVYFFMAKLPLESKVLSNMESWLGSDQAKFNDKRIQEYLAGRYCAKKAFEKAGYVLTNLKNDKNRAPVWPQEYCGSISHTKELAVSVVSKTLKSVGIDIPTNLLVWYTDGGANKSLFTKSLNYHKELFNQIEMK